MENSQEFVWFIKDNNQFPRVKRDHVSDEEVKLGDWIQILMKEKQEKGRP